MDAGLGSKVASERLASVWRAKGDSAARRVFTPRQVEVAVSVLSPLVLVALWEIIARSGFLDSRFFPAPSSIASTLYRLAINGELWTHTYVSLSRVAIGFVIGAAPAVLIGIGVGLSRFARAFVNPLIYALYPVPKVAILPLVMLIFGLGEMSKYVIIAIAVFFIVIVNTISGVVQIDRIYLDVAKNLNIRRHDLYLRVILPGALPSIFTGLKLGIGIALVVLVTSEFVGANSGLGVMIFEAWQTFAIERLYVGLIAISFLGYGLSLLFEELERWFIPWRRDR